MADAVTHPVGPNATHAEVNAAEHAPAPNVAGLDATWFVAAAMVAVILLALWKKVPALINNGLDAKIAQIRAQLDEAKALRTEAEALRAEYQAKAASADADAKAMREQAARDAAQVVADAEREAAETVARRTRLSEERIRAAEQGAIADIRARAAAATSRAAEALIVQRHDATSDRAMVDRAISSLN